MPSFRPLWGFAAAHEVLFMLYLELACLVSYAECCGWLCMRAAWLHELVGGTIGAMGAFCPSAKESDCHTGVALLAFPLLCFLLFRLSPAQTHDGTCGT